MRNDELAKGIVWDLSGLYHGDEDPELDQHLDTVRDKASSFVASYKGEINRRNLNARTLLPSLKAYESIREMGMRPYLFAYLYHSADILDHKRNRLLQKVKERWNTISLMLAFFELEIRALPEDSLIKIATHRDFSNYRHFLLNQIKLKPYALSEAEEIVLKRGHLSGRDAFISLYDQFTGSLSFTDLSGSRPLSIWAS